MKILLKNSKLGTSDLICAPCELSLAELENVKKRNGSFSYDENSQIGRDKIKVLVGFDNREYPSRFTLSSVAQMREK